MATVQKTTFRRFNGIDWDTIYFGSSADITVLGVSATVAKDEDGFNYGDVLESTDTVSMLLIKTINRLTTLETERIAALESGTGITEIDVNKLVGIIDRKNLPADVSGKGIEVADNDAKDALTLEDVNIGDIVKVTGGKIYLVTGEEPDDPEVENGPTHLTYMTLADDQSDVTWERITNKPTTVDGYGITDALKTTDAVNHGTATEDDPETFSAADKVAKTNADGKLDFDITGDAATLGGKKPEDYASADGLKAVNDAIGDTETDGTIRKDIKTLQDEMKNQDASWIKSGIISLARLPKAAISELHIITSEDDLANLTTEQVQLGDTVKIADVLNEDGSVKVAGGMFYVADETKLGTEDYKDAFIPYTAAAASSVYWNGVMETPTTLAGYGITDAVNLNQLANKGGASAAEKVAQANADGKLDFDITGDAATLGGNAAEYYASKESVTTLETKYNDTKSVVEKLVETVMGTTDPDAPPAGAVENPGIEPENPANTDPIQNGAAGDTVTWANSSWKIVNKTDKVAVVAQVVGTSARANIAGSLTDAFNAMDADAKSLITKFEVPSSTVMATYSAFTDDASRIVGDAAWWLSDGFVDETGAVMTDDPEDGSAQVYAFATINLSTDKYVVPTDDPLNAGTDEPNPVPDTPTQPAGTLVDRVVNLESLMGDAPEGYTSNVMADLAALKAGTGIDKIDASKVDGTLTRDQLPADISGRIIEIADMETAYTTLTAENASAGDLVVLSNGQVYGIKDATKLDTADGYKLLVDVGGAEIKWSQIQSTPTTLEGYGITDAVSVDDVIDNGIYDGQTNSDVAGKIVKIADDNKLHVDIAGDAATLGGQKPEYYVSKDAFDKLALSVPVMLNSVDEFKDPQIGQVVIVPVEVSAPTPEPTEPDPENP
ncbi:MAG: hypothetical protein NC489_08990 [Ruminococcus flavefaciens]|nr:hypothetical protein [Ruminococcus flavefaciens]